MSDWLFNILLWATVMIILHRHVRKHTKDKDKNISRQ